MAEPEEVPFPDRLAKGASWHRAEFRAGHGSETRYVTMAMRNGHPVVYVWTSRGPGSWPEVAFEFATQGFFTGPTTVDALAQSAAVEAADFVAVELGVSRTWAEAMATCVRSRWYRRATGAVPDPARDRGLGGVA